MKTIKTPFIIIGVGVGVGVITLAVKILKRQNREEIIRTESNRITRALKIPKGFVGHILGRGGSTIKSIREQSKARVNFDDTDNEFTVATITGSPEAVEEAATLINEIINNRHACVTKEILLQENISDSVWKNINYIRQICDLTRAKIMFDFIPSRGKDSPIKIIIKGRKEEVDSAFELIDELVAEAEVATSKQSHVAGRALPDNLPLHTSTSGIRHLPSEELIPNSSDGYIEVYVSAVENPNKFWVQICGTKSIQLDKLATEMTEFYNEEKNKDRLQVNSISAGDIVAAFYQDDNSWYRAQVINVSNENDQKKIAVFYLDFGDCATLSPDLVCILDPNFFSIPFQAIECCLAGVEAKGGKWSEEAIEAFEKMVYLAQWKVIMARPVEKSSLNGQKDSQKTVQLVNLLDTNTAKDVDVSSELIERGYGKLVC
ncbi:hypothetical protein JTE90_024952 [Oedothorax gibbosus]|uniref:Tudor domain-containing protein n=1 Tax=Oedothorax gibbosus TaxID=931172 RepID=A0AAV6VUH0_9ARAC|nr:hypothetical protein JTE90_024952 [Oedothorax gibbosus]